MSPIVTLRRVIVLSAILGTTAMAQPVGQPDPNRIVFQNQPGFVLWGADRKLEPGAVGLVYKVEQIGRSRLLLAAPSHGQRGWTPSSAVISLNLAEEYFTQAIAIKPSDPFAYMMRAVARSEKGDDDGALADLDEALKQDPRYIPALVRRAAFLRARNQPDRAMVDIEQAIAVNSREPSAYVERSVLFFTLRKFEDAWRDLDRATSLGTREVIVDVLRGQILLEKKDTKKAYDAFVNALKVDPVRHDAYLGLASVHLMRGHYKQAQAVLDDAVHADPSNPEAYGNRATLSLARGDYERALFNLGEVIRLSPGSARAYNQRAWLLATCRVEKIRDPAQAVEQATRACELSGWKRPLYLATLAAAYSETGDFDTAARCQERALALLAEKAPDRAEYQRLLDRYRARKPHHTLTLLQELGVKPYQPAGQTPG